MTKTIKRVVLGALMVSSLGLLAGCGSQNNVGVVDYATIAQQSQKGQDLNKQIAAEQQKIEQQVDEQMANADEQQQQQIQAKAQQEFTTYASSVNKQFQQDVEKTVKEIAAEKKLNVVLVKGAVVEGGTDITEDVLDKMGKAKTATPAQGQGQNQGQEQQASN